MKKGVLAAILFILLAGASYAVTDMPFPNLNRTDLVQPEKDEFTFAVLGDFRPARRDIPYPGAFTRMLDEISILHPSLILSAGDAYYGYGGSFQRFRNEVARFLSLVRATGVPFYNAIGNHEVTDDVERETFVKEVYGRLYGSFDLGSTHFIALNTEEKGREGTITGQQLAWLTKDLDANKGADSIFVFLHRPLFSGKDPAGTSFKDKANRDSLHELFRRHGVKAVFTGHEHFFEDRVKDGVRYMILGGGGAPLSKSAGQGGFYQYAVVAVNGKNIAIDVIAPEALETRRISGNDGFEPRAEIAVVNISHVKLAVGNLPFVMPFTTADRYRVRAVSIDNYGKQNDHKASIGQVRDNGDGTASISVSTVIPGNGYLRITVEADLDT